MIAGQIEIQMLADLAQLRQDMDKAVGFVDGAASKIKSLASGAAAALGALGVGISVAGLASFVKSAIDAADEASKLGQKIGVATKDLAGLQLAFELSGVGAGAMQTGMIRLAKGIDEGNDSLKALGVSTKNADGSLRSTDAVLRDVAEQFKGTEDGARKTALAVDIFGKAGADLIPLLNGGAQGLDDMEAMAQKLGLTMSEDTGKKAEEFNDTLALIQKGGTGIATQIAAQVLPALTNMAGAFLSSMTEGDGLRRTADGLAAVLKLLYSAGALVSEAFSTLGKVIGGEVAKAMTLISGLGSAVSKLFSGDFSGALEDAKASFRQSSAISQETTADITQGWSKTAATISKVWSATADDQVVTMGKITRSLGGSTQATKDSEEANKLAAAAATKHAAEQKKLDESYRKVIDSITDKAGAMLLEDQAGTKLTEGQKLALKITQDIQSGTLKLTDARKVEVTRLLEQMLATEELSDAHKREADWIKASADENIKSAEARGKDTAAILDQVEKQREANATALLSKEALAQLEIAKTLEHATSLERIATLADEIDWTGQTSAEYRKQAAGLRELADLKEKGIHVQAAKDSAAEWKKTSDSIEKGMIDSLFRAFESGKGFFSTLWSGVKNTFKTEILTPIIKDVLSPFAQAWRSIASWISSTVLTPTINMITSGLGLGTFSGTASAGAGAASSAGSLAGLGSTVAGSFGALGSGLSAGWALGADGIGASLGMIGSASGATSLAGGVGQLIGSAGPYALAAVAALAIANKLFGSKGGPKVSGLANTGNFGGIPGGGSGDAEAATILGNLQSLYSGTTSSLGGTAGNLTGAAFFARDPNGTALTQLVLDAAINGQQVYSRNNRTGGGNVEDVARDPQAFADAVAAAQTGALLASLKATTFSDAEVTAAIAAIDANASASDISGKIQSIVQAKAAKDAQAAAAAGPAAVSAGGADYFGPGTMASITPTQYDDGVASVRAAVDELRAEVASLKADNSAENTSIAVLLKTVERILVRVSGGADNPGDALSVRAITP